MSLKLVETEPTSPLDYLWRKFPELKNATCVGRAIGGNHALRTFRTLEGKYVRIDSTEDGDEIVLVPDGEIEIYESTWKELGPRALGKPSNQPHGIMNASHEFFVLTEEWIYTETMTNKGRIER